MLCKMYYKSFSTNKVIFIFIIMTAVNGGFARPLSAAEGAWFRGRRSRSKEAAEAEQQQGRAGGGPVKFIPAALFDMFPSGQPTGVSWHRLTLFVPEQQHQPLGLCRPLASSVTQLKNSHLGLCISRLMITDEKPSFVVDMAVVKDDKMARSVLFLPPSGASRAR